jgi:hypothetical protein
VFFIHDFLRFWEDFLGIEAGLVGIMKFELVLSIVRRISVKSSERIEVSHPKCSDISRNSQEKSTKAFIKSEFPTQATG